MGYYRDDSSSPGLMPIVIGLSIVALAGFGFCVYENGHVKEATQAAVPEKTIASDKVAAPTPSTNSVASTRTTAKTATASSRRAHSRA